jgi:predicted DCC family thiol-disulfide oxidoreductase YuxK
MFEGMRWAAVAAPDIEDLILFDGDCVLCSRAAHFVHERDTTHRFKFVAMQSDCGRALAARFGIEADNPETNIAVADGVAHFKADAALAVLARLPRWRWTRMAHVLPRAARNWLYDCIARNRYQLFGRRERCWAGDPVLAARILERGP